MPRKDKEKSITDDILELLDDTQIQNELDINNIKIEMIKYIINEYLKDSFLHKIKKVDILKKSKELENINDYWIENHFLSNKEKERILSDKKLKNKDDYLKYNCLDSNYLWLAEKLLERNNLLKSFCSIVLNDIIEVIIYLRDKDTKMDNSKYLSDLKKCKKHIGDFLKSHFDLPKGNLSEIQKRLDYEIENTEFYKEIYSYKIALDYVFTHKDHKHLMFSTLKPYFKTYEKKEALTGCDEFNQITNLNIAISDFFVFRDMIESYITFSGKIHTIEQGLKEQNNRFKKRYLIFNDFFKLGIKNQIDRNDFFNLIKDGYIEFCEKNIKNS